MISIFNKPYPYLFTLKRNLLVAGGVGILSMYLNKIRLNDSFFFQNTIIAPNLVSIITGLIVGISIFLVIHIIPNIFFSENRKDNWNIGNELLISAGVMFTIFTINYLFFIFISKDNSRLLSLPFFLKLGGYVVTTGMVIFSSVLWINYTITLKKNLRQVTINNEILEEKLATNEKKKETKGNIIELSSTLKSETIRFDINKLQFIKSEGNYIEIYINNDNKIEVNLYRAPLQMIYEKLNKYPQIIRTHRSFLVNVNNIKNTQGNARNYQLSFEGTDILVPVSRSRFIEFNKAFMDI